MISLFNTSLFCYHHIVSFSSCKCPACGLVLCCTLNGASLLVNKAPAHYLLCSSATWWKGVAREPEIKSNSFSGPIVIEYSTNGMSNGQHLSVRLPWNTMLSSCSKTWLLLDQAQFCGLEEHYRHCSLFQYQYL